MKDWILPTFITFFLWVFCGFLPKIITKYIDPKSAIIYEIPGAIPIAIAVLFLMNFKLKYHPNKITLAIITGIIGFLGSFCFLYAMSRGKITLVVTLTALYPILAIFLAFIFLNEPITIKQGIGIVFAFISIVLIAS